MNIKITYDSRVVGIYSLDGLYVSPLITKCAGEDLEGFLREIEAGLPVVYQDWDGQLIEFQKVVYHVIT